MFTGSPRDINNSSLLRLRVLNSTAEVRGMFEIWSRLTFLQVLYMHHNWIWDMLTALIVKIMRAWATGGIFHVMWIQHAFSSLDQDMTSTSYGCDISISKVHLTSVIISPITNLSSFHELKFFFFGTFWLSLLSAFLNTVLPLFFLFFFRNLIYMKEIYMLSIFRMSNKALGWEIRWWVGDWFRTVLYLKLFFLVTYCICYPAYKGFLNLKCIFFQYLITYFICWSPYTNFLDFKY